MTQLMIKKLKYTKIKYKEETENIKTWTVKYGFTLLSVNVIQLNQNYDTALNSFKISCYTKIDIALQQKVLKQ